MLLKKLDSFKKSWVQECPAIFNSRRRSSSSSYSTELTSSSETLLISRSFDWSIILEMFPRVLSWEVSVKNVVFFEGPKGLSIEFILYSLVWFALLFKFSPLQVTLPFLNFLSARNFSNFSFAVLKSVPKSNIYNLLVFVYSVSSNLGFTFDRSFSEIIYLFSS